MSDLVDSSRSRIRARVGRYCRQVHEHPGDPGRYLEDAVLDIGDDVGALILYTDADLAEQEVEISPVADPGRRSHTAIHERRSAGGRVFAGIFPGLAAGEYRLWSDSPRVPDRVTIVGGEVASVDWRRPGS